MCKPEDCKNTSAVKNQYKTPAKRVFKVYNNKKYLIQ